VVWKAVLLILLAVCDTSILVSHTASLEAPTSPFRSTMDGAATMYPLGQGLNPEWDTAFQHHAINIWRTATYPTDERVKKRRPAQGAVPVGKRAQR
jgi:hypothetical protein